MIRMLFLTAALVVMLGGHMAQAVEPSERLADSALETRARARIDAYQPYHAARADLLRQAGRFGEARTAYERAIALCRDEPERRFLARRLGDL